MNKTNDANRDERPATVADKEKFSSGGKRHMIVLRGKWGLAIDKALLWLTGYSLMTKQYCVALGTDYQETLLLKTIGAKTGKLRITGLPYHRVNGNYVVRGSNGGGPTDPHWVFNIRSNPPAWVRVNRRWCPVKAHVASGEERQQLYEVLCKKNHTTRRYQAMCKPRELPLVVLRPL
ncbi:MAG: nitroreductase family deazaflavin-dependent oxidoreductase [Halieaceae bacterium]|jgi:deazaflavin-dependent oxidoreductase (nitroreductase family)|nr:nitroreductase family deazaflavin-dependent oxidoreductase [Halieaceae bacterium]